MISKKIAKCLTEYKHPNYDLIVNRFDKYLTVSQFIDKPSKFDDIKSFKGMKILDKPNCGIGEILFGISENNLVELMSIIDSSD